MLSLKLPFLNVQECFQWRKLLNAQTHLTTLDLWLGERSSFEVFSGALRGSAGTLRNLHLVLPAKEIVWEWSSNADKFKNRERDPVFNWNWLTGASLKRLSMKRSPVSLLCPKIENFSFGSLDLSGLEELNLEGIRLTSVDIIRILEDIPYDLRRLQLLYWTQIEEFRLTTAEILNWGTRVRELLDQKPGYMTHVLSDWMCLTFYNEVQGIQQYMEQEGPNPNLNMNE